MKITIVILTSALFLLLLGCENIRHKSFRITSSTAGGKLTLADPSGSGNPMPTIIIGSSTTSLTTIPPGTKGKYNSTSYELFSGKPLFTESMEFDATAGKVDITDDRAQYNKNPNAK